MGLVPGGIPVPGGVLVFGGGLVPGGVLVPGGHRSGPTEAAAETRSGPTEASAETRSGPTEMAAETPLGLAEAGARTLLLSGRVQACLTVLEADTGSAARSDNGLPVTFDGIENTVSRAGK